MGFLGLRFLTSKKGNDECLRLFPLSILVLFVSFKPAIIGSKSQLNVWIWGHNLNLSNKSKLFSNDVSKMHPNRFDASEEDR